VKSYGCSSRCVFLSLDNLVAEIVLQLDVIVGTMNLTDQFEWDINNPENSPEEFADVYCRDLGLGGEFKCVLLFSIGHACFGI
jgi:hypothetical protein